MTANKAGALKIRSPLIRHRPWVSDGVWVAHESLSLFSKLAALMPSRGYWALGPTGATAARPGNDGPNLPALMADLLAIARPCVISHDDYAYSADIDTAMTLAGTQMLEVVDPDGAVWKFDLDVTSAAMIGQAGASWRIAPTGACGPGASLVLVDRKGRARFALASLGSES